MSGRAVGVQTSSAGRVFYQYNDRGRGPRLEGAFQLDSRGIPTAVEITGHDYLKGGVRETFSLRNGQASWRNRNEQGERRISGRAFYLSLSTLPEETAMLARALLSAPGGRLAMLPEGEARIERAGEIRLKNALVTQYLVYGLDFSPTPVWLDTDQELFALSSGWLDVIREGWENQLPALARAQDAAAAARTERMARSLAQKPAARLVIQGARLFDAETATVRPDSTVVISGSRIEAVGRDGNMAIPEGATVIQARGKTLLPGLWDMHAHLSETDGPLNIAAGVTTVRDLGNEIPKLLDLRRRFENGNAIGPRVLAAGFLDGAGPYAGPTKMLVSTEAEARATVDRYARLGYEQIKIYSSVKPELVPAIIDQARRHHLRVGGHVPAFMTAEDAVRAGFDEIQHVNFLFLNFLADSVKDTRQPARFTAVAERAAEMDLHADRVQAFIRLLKENNVAVDPTLNIFEAMFTDRAGGVSSSFAPVADRLPPQVRRSVLAGGLPVPHGMDERYHASFRSLLEMVGALHRAGVTILPGSDSLGGFPLQRELELYVEAGIPPAEVLRLATLGAARVMGHDRELGSIAPGKLADLVLVDGDPASRIADIRRVETVVKNGVVYQSAAVYQAIGVRP